ncbi:hypothetical protein, partial [Streptomyces sp. NPDC127072]|uniref:hypothetical protein n=1 Tax=Streptomyces sp. NPDC127072 TaxID=3347129 RepID=UPI00366970FB
MQAQLSITSKTTTHVLKCLSSYSHQRSAATSHVPEGASIVRAPRLRRCRPEEFHVTSTVPGKSGAGAAHPEHLGHVIFIA